MTKQWTRRSALALIGSGAGLLAWGSGGTTDISANRGVDVDTTGDGPGSSALLGINTLDGQRAFEAETRSLVELTNNTGDKLDEIDVRVNSQPYNFSVSIDTTPSELDDGTSGQVKATVTGAGSNRKEQTGTVGLGITAKQFDGSGNLVSKITADRDVTLSVVNCINFEKDTTDTPDGFVPDVGKPFGLRNDDDDVIFDSQSTLEYGWNRDQTAGTRKRNFVPDTEEDTLNHFIRNDRIPTEYDKSKDGYWEIDLPQGEYDVTMRCHDPQYRDQEYSFDVDGGATVVQLRDPEFGCPWWFPNCGRDTRDTHAQTYEFTVQVVSGERLSIVPPAGTYNPKISWIRFEANTGSGGSATPSISQFSIANPSGQNIEVSFDSDEILSTIEVALSGAETQTLTESEFTRNGNTYTATYSGNTDGDYTATLATAEDADGNDGASGQSDTVTVNTGPLSGDDTIVYEGLDAIEGDDGNTTKISASNVQALGPPGTDLTGDGFGNQPYLKDDDLRVVDDNGNTQTLVDSDNVADEKEPRTEETLMATGTWNGSDMSVFYANEDESKIYRVDAGGSPTAVANPADGTNAVMGIGDIDGDGQEELLFVDGSQQVRYVDDDNNTIKKLDNANAGSDDGIGAGQLPEFNGKEWALIADGSGYIVLVTDDGGNQTKTIKPDELAGNNKTAAKAPLTAADVDGDGALEIVYVEASGKKVRYVDDPFGSPSKKYLNDANGKKIKSNDELGVVSPDGS